MLSILFSLLSGLIISSIALVGFFIVSRLPRAGLRRFLSAVVPLAAGALLGAAFLDLLPESVAEGGPTFGLALIGLISFFLLDAIVWLYHCHGGHRAHGSEVGHVCPVKTVGPLSLIGDALHNITDGVIVASTFLVDPSLGLLVTIAVILHEIPQEVGDFGVLISSGFSVRSALRWNFLVALTILLGMAAVFLLEPVAQNLTLYTVPFAAGAFIYIAATNLLSEIKEEASARQRLWQSGIFLFSIVLFYGLTIILPAST